MSSVSILTVSYLCSAEREKNLEAIKGWKDERSGQLKAKEKPNRERERKTKIEKQEARHEKETDIDIILVTNYHHVHERHRPIGSRYISVRALLPG